MRSREEHLQWCKQRALNYLDQGDIDNAVAAMTSDLSKHPEMEPLNWALISLGMIYVAQQDRDGARRWIEGWR
jgi:Tfp pilus assembly protein PilF